VTDYIDPINYVDPAIIQTLRPLLDTRRSDDTGRAMRAAGALQGETFVEPIDDTHADSVDALNFIRRTAVLMEERARSWNLPSHRPINLNRRP
jgi:hypothetical protein